MNKLLKLFNYLCRQQPEAAFGKSLVDLRERIHQRVAKDEATKWQSRSIDEFSKYMEQVWKCICSANFKLTFASVMECITLDKMDYEYKMIEKHLTEAYSKKYDDLKNEMIKNKGPETTVGRNQEIDKDPQFRKYKTTLSEYISMHVIGALNERINVLVKGEGRDKWREQYKKKWDACLKDQAENWESNLKMSFTSIFNYGHHVDKYKRMMRARFNDLFRELGPTEQIDAEKKRSFQGIYKEILKAAEEEFPGLKVSDVIEEVYANSNIIMKLPNDNQCFHSGHFGFPCFVVNSP